MSNKNMPKEQFQNVEVIDEDDWFQQKQEVSIKGVILQHIKQLSNLSCQEFTAGYWEKKPVKMGTGIVMIEKYHPDVRESYINAVDFLYDTIIPYSESNTKDKFKENVNNLIKEENKQFDDAKKGDFSQDRWIIEKQKLRRLLFREIMLFLERINFWSGESVYKE